MTSPCTAPFAALILGLSLAPAAAGCKGKGEKALARAEPAGPALGQASAAAQDGPRIFALAPGVPIHARPSHAAPLLGELQTGGAVVRSAEPVSTTECSGGWYSVRPKGFVCAGPSATIDPTMVTRGLPGPPDPARALPYRYARARTDDTPVYARVPSPAEQLAAEPDLKRVLARGEDKEALGAAANDVPLDAGGVPTGPAVLQPGGEGIQDGKRTAASFFVFGSEALPPTFLPAPDGVKAGSLRKGSGVAFTGSVEAESISGLRRFAVTASGYLVPTDRLRPALGTPWHGIELDKIGLPVAFVHKLGVHTFSFSHGKAVKHDDEVERRAAVPLTGKFRTVNGVRYEETREGQWMRAQDLVLVVKRHRYPEFVKAGVKWLDVSVANQTLTAYDGTKPVYATLISTGRDMLKDPATSASTPRGTFRLAARHVSAALDPREVSGSFDVTDAPWVMDAEGSDAGSFSFAGMYWTDGLGEASTFHDVGLSPIDAHRLWTWAGPALPEGWHAAYGELAGGLAGGEPPMVFVRP